MSGPFPDFMITWWFLILMLLLLFLCLFLLPRWLVFVLAILLALLIALLVFRAERAARLSSPGLLGRLEKALSASPVYRTPYRERAEELLNRLKEQTRPSVLREMLPELKNLVRDLAEAGDTDPRTRRLAEAVNRLDVLLEREPSNDALTQTQIDLASALEAWLELVPGGRYRQAA